MDDFMNHFYSTMAQSRERQAPVDDPETTAIKLRDNDPTLRSIVIGSALPDPFSLTIHKRLPPERLLPETKEEWISVGEQIGAHGYIEEFEIYQLEYESRFSLTNLEAMLAGMANNRSIKLISFHDCNIERSAFEVIAPLLASNKNLRKVDVTSCYLNDPFRALAPVLGSSTLEEFRSLGNHFPRSFTFHGVEEVDRCLCDTTSINATYQSNHTLSSLAVYNTSEDGDSERLVQLPKKLKDSIKLNKNANKADVAWEKILRNHFAGNFNVEPFEEDCMDQKVLPFLLSWIGSRPGLGPAPDEQTFSLMTGETTSTPGMAKMCTQSAMFELLRGIPERLFESECRKGRKRQKV